MPRTRREFVRNLSAMSALSFVGVTSRQDERAEREPLVSAKDAVDHLLLGVADREAGIRWVQERTGIKAVTGGSHPGVGTHNALLSLGDRHYLEIIAPDPDQTQLAPRYQMLRALNTPRLITWAAATDNGQKTVERCRAAGLEILGPNPGARRRPDGKMMRWITVNVKTDLEVVIPFFIEWERTVTHPSTDSPQGCRLQTVAFWHPQPARVRETLARMGIDATVNSSPEAAVTAFLHTPKGAVELR